MSYEGYTEFLCKEGHYFCMDCCDDGVTRCPRCGATVAYTNSVDQTNGEDPDLPCTMPGPKKLVEKRSRRITVDDSIYEPDGPRWRKL